MNSTPSAWIALGKEGWLSASENSFLRIQSPRLKLRNDQIIDVTQLIDSKPEGSRFYEDEQGILWVGKNDRKIHRGTPDGKGGFSFESFPLETRFSTFGSRMIGDGAGGVWLGQPLFLGRFRNGEYKTVEISEGLPEKDPRSFFKDSRGWLWIGLGNKGVSVTHEPAADNPVFINYARSNSPLSSNAVRSITEDNQGRMYFATDIGINRFDLTKNEWTLFSSKNGLAGDLTYGVLKDKNGVIWAATNGGLSRIDTSFEKKPNEFPPIYLSKINVAGKDLALPETGLAEVKDIELDAASNNLTISFVAPNFQNEDLSYQYQLGDGDWSKPSKERSVSFSLLPPNKYRFRVRLVNQNGVFSPNTASFEFRILPPIWQRWWFVLGVLSIFGLIVYWLYRFRVSKLLEIERTRTRIATDLHDDIGTNLSKISLLSEIVKMQSAGENGEKMRMLEVIGETSRESVGAMSDIVWAINPKKDSLADMTRRMRQHAEEVFLEKGVTVKFNAPEDNKNLKLSMDIRRELYLIYKEAVTNSAKHSDCQTVEINFQVRQNQLFLSIKDDGKGFDSSENFSGNGLQNLKIRAKKINAKLEVKSEIGNGTTVFLSTDGHR
jgi:two-component sensor histidine kinase